MFGEASHLVDVGPAQEEKLADAGVSELPDGFSDLVIVAHQRDRGCSQKRDRPGPERGCDPGVLRLSLADDGCERDRVRAARELTVRFPRPTRDLRQ